MDPLSKDAQKMCKGKRRITLCLLYDVKELDCIRDYIKYIVNKCIF